ncbi:hypothetical protein EAG_07969 [Camponotus floridanus]|uniref:Uncharacterized protein n=1 Tax=Camponotus floridanus TaxID=104421 RepID=E2ACW4_CAMFO|nr:hypothetical protein EAG_07969 [Camponotus floridanus]
MVSCCFDVSLSNFREHTARQFLMFPYQRSPLKALISLEEYRENVTAIKRKVDPSLMLCRAFLGWNFKQQHLVDRRTAKHDKNLVSPFFVARRDIESSYGERERDRRSVDQSEVKAPGDAVREIRFGVPAANVDGKGHASYLVDSIEKRLAGVEEEEEALGRGEVRPERIHEVNDDARRTSAKASADRVPVLSLAKETSQLSSTCLQTPYLVIPREHVGLPGCASSGRKNSRRCSAIDMQVRLPDRLAIVPPKKRNRVGRSHHDSNSFKSHDCMTT